MLVYLSEIRKFFEIFLTKEILHGGQQERSWSHLFFRREC